MQAIDITDELCEDLDLWKVYPELGSNIAHSVMTKLCELHDDKRLMVIEIDKQENTS